MFLINCLRLFISLHCDKRQHAGELEGKLLVGGRRMQLDLLTTRVTPILDLF
jgi:hypothetical protein